MLGALTYQMKNFGDVIINEMVIEKMLRIHTIKFDHIMLTIEKTKKLSDIKIEDLHSTLESFELNMVERNYDKE